MGAPPGRGATPGRWPCGRAPPGRIGAPLGRAGAEAAGRATRGAFWEGGGTPVFCADGADEVDGDAGAATVLAGRAAIGAAGCAGALDGAVVPPGEALGRAGGTGVVPGRTGAFRPGAPATPAGVSTAAGRAAETGAAAGGAAGRAVGLAFAAAAFAVFSASAAASAAARSRKCLRTRSACSCSSELECVFFSAMPSSGRYSIKTLALISSSLASSLIRIWPDSDMKLRIVLRHARTGGAGCLALAF